MEKGTQETQAFYDSYWPNNVPNYEHTRGHVFSLLPGASFDAALDAGAGTGVCTLALAERARTAVGIDISCNSLRTARQLATRLGRSNVSFSQSDLHRLPFDDNTFDVVHSWGVVDHTLVPRQVMTELARVLRPGGYLIVAVYLRRGSRPSTSCRGILPPHTVFPGGLLSVALVNLSACLTPTVYDQCRDDNINVEARPRIGSLLQSSISFPSNMRQTHTSLGLSFEVLVERTGRLKAHRTLSCGVKASMTPLPEDILQRIAAHLLEYGASI
jgi:SAM-dependent methyltransferase